MDQWSTTSSPFNLHQTPRRAMPALLALLVVSLVACRAPCSCPSADVSKLTLSNVHQVSALEHILTASSSPSTTLQGIASYPSSSSPSAGPLRALLSVSGTLYALDLTAQSAQVV